MSKLRISLDDFFNNLNTHPVPMEFSKGLTTGERLDSIYSLICEYLDHYEEYADAATEKIDSSLDNKYREIESLVLSEINGQLSSDEVIKKIKMLLDSSIADAFKYVTFGLSEDGYFIANIPDTWNAINFDTNIDIDSEDYGKLIVEY